jgi:hypothetical protein
MKSCVPYHSYLPTHQLVGIAIGCVVRARHLCNEIGWYLNDIYVIAEAVARLHFLKYPKKVILNAVKRPNVFSSDRFRVFEKIFDSLY